MSLIVITSLPRLNGFCVVRAAGAFSRILVIAVLLVRSLSSPATAQSRVDPISANFLMPFAEDFLTPADAGLAYETVHFENQNGETLRGWMVFAAGTSRPEAPQTILFCMGNTGNISAMLMYAKIMALGGYDVLLFDYQGYGSSTGIATAMSIYGDSMAAFDYLIGQRGLSSDQIGVYGVSLGSVLAIAVAAEKKAAAVLVEDVFLPADHVAAIRDQLPRDLATQLALGAVENVVLPQVDPVRNAARLACPLCLLHGENDSLLPPAGSLKVYAAATCPRRIWIIPSAGHAPETVEVCELEYAEQAVTFFRDAFSGRITDQPPVFDSRPSGDLFESTITVQCQGEQCMQVALCSFDGQFHYARPVVTTERTLTLLTTFRPELALATSMLITERLAGNANEWTLRQSPLSADLADFAKLKSELVERPGVVESIEQNGRVFRLHRWTSEDWEWLQLRLPQPDDVHERIRPRYARLLAAFACRLGKNRTELPQWKRASELALTYLPETPESYYELGNAQFKLGLRDPGLSRVLQDLAIDSLKNAMPQQAAQQIALMCRVDPWIPPGTDVPAADVQAVKTAEDLDNLLRKLRGQ